MQVYVTAKQSYEQWISTITEEQDDPKGQDDYARYIRAGTACSLFTGQLQAVQVSAATTLNEVVGEAIGQSPRPYSLDAAKNLMPGLAKQRKSLKGQSEKRLLGELSKVINSAYNTNTELYRFVKRGEYTPIAGHRTVAEAQIADDDILFTRERSISTVVESALTRLEEIVERETMRDDPRAWLGGGGAPCASAMSVRDCREFLAFVQFGRDGLTRPQPSWSRSRQRPVLALLYTNEDPQIASYVRTHFDALDKASGEHCDVVFIEAPTVGAGRLYWKGLLETKIYGLWRLLGWTESVPYDRTAAYSIADSLGVSYDKLPCAAVVLPNSPGAQQVVPLSGDLTQSFRTLFAAFQKPQEAPYATRLPSRASRFRTLLDWEMHNRQHPEQELIGATPSPTCFLSHNRLDKDLVRRVAVVLHSVGINTWFDEWEILPGDSIPEKISDGLRQSAAVVVFLSPNAANSRWVQAEMNATLFQVISSGSSRIIPVLVQACDVPPLLAHYANVNVGPHSQQIAAAIRRAVLGETDKPPLTTTR